MGRDDLYVIMEDGRIAKFVSFENLKAEIKRNQGIVLTRRCRETGYYVSIYDGSKNDMDTFAGRWQTVCEEHGGIISHETRARAEACLSHPLDWCEHCQEERANQKGDGDDHTL